MTIDTTGMLLQDDGSDYTRLTPQSVQAEVKLLVSSRSMILASPVFRVMLRNCFRKSGSLDIEEKLEISLPCDDVEAMTILLDIVHLRSRRVPKRVSLGLLTKLAVLVDKYQMLEATDVFASLWITDLKHTLPKSYNNDYLAWLTISWVFKLPEAFQNLTAIGEHESTHRIDAGDLPISCLIIGMHSLKVEFLPLDQSATHSGHHTRLGLLRFHLALSIVGLREVVEVVNALIF